MKLKVNIPETPQEYNGNTFTLVRVVEVEIDDEEILKLAQAIEAAQQTVQSDGAYCVCENSNFFVSDLGLTCWTCKKPRR